MLAAVPTVLVQLRRGVGQTLLRPATLQHSCINGAPPPHTPPRAQVLSETASPVQGKQYDYILVRGGPQAAGQ